MLQVSKGAGIGIPNFGTLFKAEGTVSVMFNTTKQDVHFDVPKGTFDDLIKNGFPSTIDIFGSAPRSTASATRTPRPAARSTSRPRSRRR